MKRILLLFAIILCAGRVSAQQGDVSVEQYISNPIKQWTSSFTTIDVDAPIRLTLTQISSDQAPYIVYDTKGNETSRFTAEVEKGQVLKIRERYDPKRASVTEVQVFYNTLDHITISRADTQLNGALKTKMLDVEISNNAKFVAELDVKDLVISVNGNCGVEITGKTLYQMVNVTSSQYNAARLETMSTIVESHHNAEVRVYATQRLEAKSTTGGKIMYKSTPEILRTEKTLFGVDPTPLK